uniref:DUF1295 domain-containing protein n=1 Tax=Desulfacinum infernum TaxID=35837 RepID=A0A831ZKG2_9BACT
MAPVSLVMASSLGAALILMIGLWPFTVIKKNASLADRFWGLGFVVVAWVSALLGPGFGLRTLLVVALTTLWGLRLSAHITYRSWGKGEDPRYRAMREKHGAAFPIVSLLTVFGFQAVLLWIIALPVQWACLVPYPNQLTVTDLVGGAVALAGIGIESLADYQLLRFKKDPANRGKVMDRGLWAYSRHPNYFGETLVWWGMFLIALSVPGGVWTIVSPALITFLLLRVSGVTLLERTLTETRPEYRDYMERTSTFIPWFPKKSKEKGM